MNWSRTRSASIMSSGLLRPNIIQNKLKNPLEELETASKRIAENDLDFWIT